MAIGTAEVAVLSLWCVVAVSQPPVLAFISQRVLIFPRCAAYEVEWDGF